ncbi:MAG: HypC/HybG/HupF family hydrogenase formation chaperone [Syntrophorhabdales bacterium]|jgi:hydrogenase expression/formation protein HypC
MCLAVPALIKSVDGSLSDVDMGGIETRVSILFTPDVKVGDYVIVHAGFAISTVDADEAMETLQLLEMIAGGDEE